MNENLKDRYGDLESLKKSQKIANGYIDLAKSLIERAKFDIEEIQKKIDILEKQTDEND